MKQIQSFCSISRSGVLLFVVLLLAGGVPAWSCSLLVAAASDLSSLEEQLKRALPACDIRVTFASSGTLTRQILAGADFDVFLAASKRFASEVTQAGAADPASLVTYARGRVALWSRGGLRFQDLAKASRISIANPRLAPYGLAARQVLERQGLWKQLEPNIVYGENVRQAWQFASTGNVDAGLISWSLVYDKGGQLLPAEWHDPIEQTAVIPRSARHPEDAKRFLAWLLSAAGQKLLGAHGLQPVR